MEFGKIIISETAAASENPQDIMALIFPLMAGKNR
jgi:hypothetical protein